MKCPSCLVDLSSESVRRTDKGFVWCARCYRRICPVSEWGKAPATGIVRQEVDSVLVWAEYEGKRFVVLTNRQYADAHKLERVQF